MTIEKQREIISLKKKKKMEQIHPEQICIKTQHNRQNSWGTVKENRNKRNKEKIRQRVNEMHRDTLLSYNNLFSIILILIRRGSKSLKLLKYYGTERDMQRNRSSQTQQMEKGPPDSSSPRLDWTLWSFMGVFILLKSINFYFAVIISHCLQNCKSKICSLTGMLYIFQRWAMW